MKGLIDIGAHYAEEYFDLSPEERENMNWIFFEPLKEVYAEMCKRLPKTPNIKTFNVALGNSDGYVEMFTETQNNGQSSSILKPKLHLKLYPTIVFNGRETVKLCRLDDIDYDRGLYDNMHIDVQGYEMEVLKGAINSLANIQKLTVEVNKDEIYEGVTMVWDIDNFLSDFGFSRTSTHWWHELWGDATYERGVL